MSEALKSRRLVTWIADDRIVIEINEKIIDCMDHTECMLVFVTETENYVGKVNIVIILLVDSQLINNGYHMYRMKEFKRIHIHNRNRCNDHSKVSILLLEKKST